MSGSDVLPPAPLVGGEDTTDEVDGLPLVGQNGTTDYVDRVDPRVSMIEFLNE